MSPILIVIIEIYFLIFIFKLKYTSFGFENIHCKIDFSININSHDFPGMKWSFNYKYLKKKFFVERKILKT